MPKGINSHYYLVKHVDRDTINVNHASPMREALLGQSQDMVAGDTLDDGTTFEDLQPHASVEGRWIEITSDGTIIDDPPPNRQPPAAAMR